MNAKKSLENAFRLFCEKGLILFLNFLLVILLARNLDQEQFGTYTSIIAFSSLFLPLTTLGLNNLISKYFIKFPHAHYFYLNAAIRIRICGALLALGIGIFIALFIYQNEIDIILISILLAAQLFNIFNVIEYYFLSQQRVSNTQVHRVAIRIFIRCMLIITAIQQGSNLLLISIFSCEYILIALVYFKIYNKEIQNKPKYFRNSYIPTMKRLFHKSKWLFFSSIAMILYLKIDQIMIGKMLGMQETAKYAVAAKLSEFWYVFPVIFANAFNSLLTRNYLSNREKFEHNCKLILSSLFLISIILATVTTCISQPLIYLLFGEQYTESAAILSIHIWACIFIFPRAILSKWLIITNNYKYSLYSHLSGAVINILLNLVMLPIYGAKGAAIASVVSYAVAGFISLLFFKSTRKFVHLMISAIINCVPNFFLLLSLRFKKHV